MNRLNQYTCFILMETFDEIRKIYSGYLYASKINIIICAQLLVSQGVLESRGGRWILYRPTMIDPNARFLVIAAKNILMTLKIDSSKCCFAYCKAPLHIRVHIQRIDFLYILHLYLHWVNIWRIIFVWSHLNLA